MLALAFVLIMGGALLIYAGITGQGIVAPAQRILTGGKA